LYHSESVILCDVMNSRYYDEGTVYAMGDCADVKAKAAVGFVDDCHVMCTQI